MTREALKRIIDLNEGELNGNTIRVVVDILGDASPSYTFDSLKTVAEEIGDFILDCSVSDMIMSFTGVWGLRDKWSAAQREYAFNTSRVVSEWWSELAIQLLMEELEHREIWWKATTKKENKQ